MTPDTPIIYVMHGTSISGDVRHHFGTTTYGRFRKRCREHKKDRTEPFNKWAKAELAVVDYQIVKYKCSAGEEAIYNMHPAPEWLCPICKEETKSIPF